LKQIEEDETGMSDAQVEKVLANTRFTMEMEGFTVDMELEDNIRKILTGELRLEDYIESVKQEARRFANEARAM
jgi:hypothetical protein